MINIVTMQQWQATRIKPNSTSVVIVMQEKELLKITTNLRPHLGRITKMSFTEIREGATICKCAYPLAPG